MKKILVCGQVDHGKTTLIQAMNAYFKEYYDIDTEENEGGSLRMIGRMHAVFNLGGTDYDYFDLPGEADYEDFFENPDNHVDAAVLVCAACDGALPGTIAAMKRLAKKGVSKIVVYMSKIDVTDDEDLIMFTEEDLRDLLEQNGFGSNVSVIKGKVQSLLDALFPEEPARKRIIFNNETAPQPIKDRNVLNPLAAPIVKLIQAVDGLF